MEVIIIVISDILSVRKPSKTTGFSVISSGIDIIESLLLEFEHFLMHVKTSHFELILYTMFKLSADDIAHPLQAQVLKKSCARTYWF